MELKIKAPYEPLDVEIGPTLIKTSINVSPTGMIDVAEAISKAKQKVTMLSKLRDDAQASNNIKKIREANAKIADVLEGAVKAGIGDADYDAIVLACGQGREIPKADCNIVMLQVLLKINEAIEERMADSLDEKAAHYLSEVEDAQPEPNAEDPA